MNKLLHQLQNNDWTLLVSLPRNDVELAKAAIGAGAQGLKIHINVEHFASGTRFGSFREERDNLARIVQAAGEASVGVVPGGSPFATEEEFAAMAEIGIDYFDAYPADAPAWTLTQRHLGRMLAAYDGGGIDMMQALERAGMQMCEASVMPHDQYGTGLTAQDTGRYAQLTGALAAPVIVPSQKKLTPADVPALRAAGLRGVLIGAIVTGKEAAAIEQAVRAFREAG